MNNYLSIILISTYLYLIIKYPIVQTQKLKIDPEICVENQFPNNSIYSLKLCYLNNRQEQFILVWFTIGRSLNDTFDLYRFVLRSDDHSLSSRARIETLTDFTKLIDLNNSLSMFNLDSGQYEVCIEFKSDSPLFIYQPRDGCIMIAVGRSSFQSFQQSSTPLLIALASGIVMFFILGLVVQWAKEKRRKKLQDEENNPQLHPVNTLSALSLKQKRDRLIRNFFRRHIDEPRSSRVRQWARNHAFRHRISTQEQEQEFEKPKWTRHLFPSRNHSPQARPRMPTSAPNLTTNNIYTISKTEHEELSPRSITFHLAPSEEYEMI